MPTKAIETVCAPCRKRILKRFPYGKTIYIGKNTPIDRKKLSRLLRQGVRVEKLAVQFGVTVRRIQQLASHLGLARIVGSGHR